MKVATKADITILDAAIIRLENKIEAGLRDLTIRTGGMLVVAVGILLGIKFLG
jgi:hypothetical protein